MPLVLAAACGVLNVNDDISMILALITHTLDLHRTLQLNWNVVDFITIPILGGL